MRSFISSFKAVFIALLVIIGIEASIKLLTHEKKLHSNLIAFSYLDVLSVQRVLINLKLDIYDHKKFEFIQVGDSSGLYGVKPFEVMKYLENNEKYLNMSCCADTGYTGYRYIAQRFLQDDKRKKYLVLHITPYSFPMQMGKGFSDLLYDALIAPQHILYDKLPSMSKRLDVTNAIFYGSFQHKILRDFTAEVTTNKNGVDTWAKVLPDTNGWVPFIGAIHQDGIVTGPCNFDSLYYDEKGKATLVPEFEKIKRVADKNHVKLIILFNPVACTYNKSIDPIIQDVENFKKKHPDVYIPFPVITTWAKSYFYDNHHLNDEGASIHSADIGKALAKIQTKA
jgi:hypothetical protein